MAKRINGVIELIESKEPVYYTSAGDLTYENGLKQASTWADFLIPEFENFLRMVMSIVGVSRERTIAAFLR